METTRSGAVHKIAGLVSATENYEIKYLV